MVKAKCNMCDNMGLRQFCYEHKRYHVHGKVHGKVHIETEYKGMNEWLLCNACAERER